MRGQRSSKQSVQYYLREGVLFLALSYVILLGGTFNGLVMFELNLSNTLLLGAIGVLWLGWRVLGRRIHTTTGLDWPIFALLTATVITTILSVDPRRSLIACTQVAVYIFVFYLVVDLLRNGWPAELFAKALLIASCFIIFFGLWEIARWYIGWYSISGASELLPASTLRIRAFLGHPNFVAAFFILILPLGLTRLAETTRMFNRIVLGIWAVMVLILVFFTSSRGGWLGMASALFVIVFLLVIDRPQLALSKWRKLRQKPILAVFLVLVAVLGSLLLVQGMRYQVQHPTHGTSGVGSRTGIWGVAWTLFREDPISGHGPFTYGTEYIRQHSIPPGMLLAHAHNFVFNVAAESGVLGLLALFLFIPALLRQVRNRWRNSVPGDRFPLIAILASLSGFTVHSMFDTPETFPALNIITAILLAILIADERLESDRFRSWVVNGMVFLCWVGVTGCMWYSLRPYRLHTNAVLASNRGDWTSAAELLDQAVTLDPEMAFYWLQSGYAHGQLALDENGMVQDSGEAKLATEAYERGLAIEPNYATNWANLGVLYWALGDRSGAIEDLTLAVELAPREASFRLTLGRMHEADNQLEQAKADYLEALSQRPHWAYSEFFRKTEFRERLITDWIAQYPYAHHPGGQELLEGWMAFDQGRYAHARAFFEDTIGVNTTEAYLGLGMSNLRLGNFEAAKLALLKAKTVPHLSGWVRVQTSLTLGSIEKAVGNYTQAILHFESALETLRATTSLGIGRMGNSDYGWYIFYRSSIAADLLPGIDYLLYTDQVIKGMLELAECYLIEGDRESVKRIYTDVIEISPEYPFEESWLKEIES